MAAQLAITVGQWSEAGRKPVNQDFHGACHPSGALLTSKGVVVAIADGIGSSEVSHIASETAVKAFLEDYYCTSEALSVRRAASQVLRATNSWLHAETQRSRYRQDMDRGFVCTLSALVVKSTTAHLFHVGDARIYRVAGTALEPLTRDHRHWVAGGRSYLSRALGADGDVEIDYHSLPVDAGDTFLLATDGVHEHVAPRVMAEAIRTHAPDLDAAARAIVDAAAARGSPDNLTVQIVRVDALPERGVEEMHQHLTALPFPPALEARATLDGFEIVRELHANHRSHVYLARDGASGVPVALKTPASDLRDDPAAVERFLTEEWVARRIDSPFVVRPWPQERRRSCLYVVMEYLDGQTLTQWMTDHPQADLERVRGIVEQIAGGLRAFHRQEMVHQDVRPDNVVIDASGTARIIDFGSTRVAGITESLAPGGVEAMLGTEQYSAPELFLGARGSPRSDLFSLGVVAYQMLTGRLPYGPEVARIRSRAGLNRLRYTPARKYNGAVPAWVDGALRTALQPDPEKRYQEVAEFAYDLRHPRRAFVEEARPPLIERDPERFWKALSALLGVAVAILAYLLINR